MTYGCVRGLLNCSTGDGWQSKRGQSGRSASGVKRDRSAAASQSYAKQNCQWHAVSPLSCPTAEQHNCQHSTAHKVSDPQSESGSANGMRNKTQRSVSPAEWASSNLPARSERQKHAPPRWDHIGQLRLDCPVFSYRVPTKMPTNIPTKMPTEVPTETGYMPTFTDL